MHPAIAQHRSGISAICKRYHIHRLEVFGSAARETISTPPAATLIFSGVCARRPARPRGFFGAKTDLEKLLGRGVDLVEPGAVRNPYVLASINRNREAVYAT